ncbi:MAG: hypothetical protein IPG45_11645 [Deltaproteobacteria bacterium]|nr:hypothetical protein [Deltaproteobacteria bacterium]
MKLRGALLIGLAATACNEPYSNEDLLFLKALPPELQVELPGATATTTSSIGTGVCAAPSPDFTPAKFYCDANKAASDINAVLDTVLNLVGSIAAYPPTTRDTDLRIWGPFPIENGLEAALSIERIRTSTGTLVRYTGSSEPALVYERFRFAISARKQGEGEWKGLVYGESAPTGEAGTRMGWLALDFDAQRTLDPTKTDRGAIGIAYDTRGGKTILNVYADVARYTPMFDPEAAYFYEAPGDGSGTFLFYQRANVIETTEALETMWIQVRWRPDLRGRADVVVRDGDAAPQEYWVVQCWDPNFAAVFQTTNVPTNDYPNIGQVSACGPELQ